MGFVRYFEATLRPEDLVVLRASTTMPARPKLTSVDELEKWSRL